MRKFLAILILTLGMAQIGLSAPTGVSTNQFYITNGVAMIHPALLVGTNTPVRSGTNVFTGTNQFTNPSNQFNGTFSGTGTGLTNLLTTGIRDLFTSNARLIELTTSEAYQLTVIAYDGDGVVTTATVLWPDGSGGTFTTVTKNATFLTIDAFTVTHTVSGKTITQSLVSRNGSGYITNKPALTITP